MVKKIEVRNFKRARGRLHGKEWREEKEKGKLRVVVLISKIETVFLKRRKVILGPLTLMDCHPDTCQCKPLIVSSGIHASVSPLLYQTCAGLHECARLCFVRFLLCGGCDTDRV